MRHSIVRRSFLVGAAFVSGHGLSYLLLLLSTHLLDKGGFGLFYAATVAVSIGFAPCAAVIMVLVRRLAHAYAEIGPESAVALARKLVLVVLKFGLPAAVAASTLIVVVAPYLGIASGTALVFIPPMVVALVVIEIERAALHAMLRFARASLLWIIAKAAQVGLALAALAATARVWPGIAGMLAGVVVVAAWFSRDLLRKRRVATVEFGDAGWRELKAEVPFVAGYSLFVVLNNLDLLSVYWLLSRAAEDVYAASALLPKAIVIVTLPIAQVSMPVLIERRAGGEAIGFAMFKAFALVAGLAALAAAILIAGVPYVQGTSLMPHGLDMTVMTPLLVAAVALSILRLMVVVELALGRRGVALAQIVPVLVVPVATALAPRDPHSMAIVYTVCCCGYLVAALSWMVVLRVVRGRGPPPPRTLRPKTDVFPP